MCVCVVYTLIFAPLVARHLLKLSLSCSFILTSRSGVVGPTGLSGLPQFFHKGGQFRIFSPITHIFIISLNNTNLVVPCPVFLEPTLLRSTYVFKNHRSTYFKNQKSIIAGNGCCMSLGESHWCSMISWCDYDSNFLSCAYWKDPLLWYYFTSSENITWPITPDELAITWENLEYRLGECRTTSCEIIDYWSILNTK